MSELFPFGFPGPTAFYLSLYVFTLSIHVVFMNYVLGGSAYLGWRSVKPGAGAGGVSSETANGVEHTLRDWMPFALGAAITAGVAPLLFVQILYQQHFYTANLLLFNRWMFILPALIIGFYLLYLRKSKMVSSWPMAWRTIAGLGAMVCFLFTAWTWTENHMLSLRGQGEWSKFYTERTIAFFEPVMIPRLLVWFCGAFATMAMLLGWQMRRSQQASDARRLAVIAISGLALAAMASGVYWLMMGEADRAAVNGTMARPYLWIAMLGAAMQVVGWLAIRRIARLTGGWLTLVTTGCAMGIVGTAVLREAIRIATIDIAAVYGQHRDAATMGGFTVFVAFFLINAVLIVWCVRIAFARRGANHR
jgi:hypothetical protein